MYSNCCSSAKSMLCWHVLCQHGSHACTPLPVHLDMALDINSKNRIRIVKIRVCPNILASCWQSRHEHTCTKFSCNCTLHAKNPADWLKINFVHKLAIMHLDIVKLACLLMLSTLILSSCRSSHHYPGSKRSKGEIRIRSKFHLCCLIRLTNEVQLAEGRMRHHFLFLCHCQHIRKHVYTYSEECLYY